MTDTMDLDKKPVARNNVLAREVPTIDLSDVRSVSQIADACHEWGFFQVINHGVSEQLIADTWRCTRDFFAQPSDRKDAVLRSRENPWGYYNNELTKNQRDKKEVFDFTTDGLDPIYEAENRWPEGVEKFRETLTTYRDACTTLSLQILERMSEGLDLPPSYFEELFNPDHTGFVRLNYYPVADPLAGRSDVEYQGVADMGVHHHSDAGALTVLLQDSVGGLQVYNKDAWYEVPPQEGAFVINTGDMMQVWSNDRYRAAIHRAQAMDVQDRYSIPFFFNPKAGTLVEPLSSVVSEASPARYRPVPWSDFRYKRTDGNYADYGDEVQIAQYREPGQD